MARKNKFAPKAGDSVVFMKTDRLKAKGHIEAQLVCQNGEDRGAKKIFKIETFKWNTKKERWEQFQ